MSMRDTAKKLLKQTCDELSAAKARRNDIKDAATMLENANVSEDIIKMLDAEFYAADCKVRDLLIQRFLMRSGMRAHGWLADGE